MSASLAAAQAGGPPGRSNYAEGHLATVEWKPCGREDALRRSVVET
jgi:hypothetical protein